VYRGLLEGGLSNNIVLVSLLKSAATRMIAILISYRVIQNHPVGNRHPYVCVKLVPDLSCRDRCIMHVNVKY
jgi:hypothetical protein